MTNICILFFFLFLNILDLKVVTFWWQGKNAPLFSRTLVNTSSNWLKPRKVDLKIREYRKKYSLLKYFKSFITSVAQSYSLSLILMVDVYDLKVIMLILRLSNFSLCPEMGWLTNKLEQSVSHYMFLM